jgi:hypothetical protein
VNIFFKKRIKDLSFSLIDIFRGITNMLLAKDGQQRMHVNFFETK